MFPFFTILLIGISLSMDAFSLAMGYGLAHNNQNDFILSLIVGIFHFFMPLIGNILGYFFKTFNFFNINLVASLILLYLGVEMIVSNFKKEEISSNYFMFALAVSIDSLTLGIGLKAITNNIFLSSFIFSICSFSFTFLGLAFGKFMGKYIGKYSKTLGGIILMILSFVIFHKKY